MEGSLPRIASAPLLDDAERNAFARAVTVAGLLIAAIWLVAMSRWILTDSVVPWDSKNQFYAFYRFLASSLHAGTSPFWNPYHYGGHPAVADPQSLIFAPLMVLYALIDAAPSMRTFDLLVHAHLLIGGLAVVAIGARARWPVAACVLAATVFMFGGPAAGRLQHTGIILSYGLFPLAWLLLQFALERRSLVSASAFAVVAATLALGRNQVAMLLCFALAAAAVAAVATAQQPLRYLRERAAVLGIMLGLGLALIAAPMLLTLQFAALSNRPAITLDQALLGSLHPAGLAQLMVADIFGSHRADYWGPNGATEPLVAYTDDSFNYLFVGAVPIILLLWFGLAGARALRRGRILLASIAALSVLYALGGYTPFFSLIFDWVPGVSRFRRPVDASFVFVAALAVLCGHLLADYVREGLPPRRLLAGFAMALGIAPVVAGVVFSARTEHSGDALAAAIASMPIVAAAIAILALARGERMRSVAAITVAGIAIGELVCWNVAFRLNAEPHYAYAVLERPSGSAADALALIERAVGERRGHGERPRVELVGLGGPWQNLAMVRSLEVTNGYNPLRIGTYDRLVAPGESNWRLDLRDFPASFDNYDCALARALGLEYLLLGRPIEEVPHLRRRPVAEMLRAGPDIWIYRLKNPSPQVVFTGRVRVADSDGSNGPGLLAASRATDHVLIDDDTPPLRRYAGAASGDAGKAQIVSWRPARVEIAVESDLGGVLALHGTWYPGWVAEVDNKRTPILRADVLFRAVEVPAGQHRVMFRYEPFSLENLAAALTVALRRRQ